MSRWQDQPRNRHESVTIRTIWLTLALSLLIHVGALLVLIPHLQTTPGDLAPDEASAPVQVQLTPRPSVVIPAAPEPPKEAQASIQPPVRPPKVATRPPPKQAMVVPRTPAPEFVMPAPPPPPPAPPPVAAATPPPPSPAPAVDLAAFIAAKRAARGEPTTSTADDEKERYNRNIAANMPTAATGTAGRAPRNGGGIFQIKRMAYDDAVFDFYGWNKDVGQRTPQSFEVRKGNNPDMRLAVVRKMIVLIREHDKEEIVWESKRLGRNVLLSSRVQDNAALEEFMLHEFFDEARPY